MSLLAFGFLLLQASAAQPPPGAAPTPTPTPRPVSAGPRSLQDVARERRLSGATKGKGALGTISVGPSTQSSSPKGLPEAVGTPEVTPEPAPEAAPEASSASVRVATVSNDGIVDSAGVVRVNGTVRNAGSRAACNVVVTVKILDSRGNYLSSAEAAPDIAVIPPGDVVSFHAVVQAPPGVRGGRTTNPDRRDLTGGSTTIGGEWKILGGTEAAVVKASEECAR